MKVLLIIGIMAVYILAAVKAVSNAKDYMGDDEE